MANIDGPNDINWYFDSRATHHLTNDLNNMNISEPFVGNSKLMIRNGDGLCITDMENSVLKMRDFGNSITLKLNNMLFVPQITKNLISVS